LTPAEGSYRRHDDRKLTKYAVAASNAPTKRVKVALENSLRFGGAEFRSLAANIWK
jgi:hypothetical protein